MKKTFSWLTQTGIVGLALLALVIGTMVWFLQRIRKNMQAGEQARAVPAENFQVDPSAVTAVVRESAAPDLNGFGKSVAASDGLQFQAQSPRLADAPGIVDGA